MKKNGLKALLIFFYLLFCTDITQALQDLDALKYFDTSFLSNYDLVAETLKKEEGFKDIYFTTPDNLLLHGLILKRPQAHYNIIFCAGFYPGRKEGLANIYKMLPEDCNILFFDARGHGKSQGYFLSILHQYGNHEYKDVIGVLNIVNELNKLPIIIHGTCIGAFHTAHAIIALQKNNALSKFNIKGLIFDSIPVSILQMVQIPKTHFREKILPSWFRHWYTHDTKEQIKQRYIFRLTSTLISGFLSSIEFIAQPTLKYNHERRHLADKISQIKYPILYIHAYDDTYANIKESMYLADKTQSVCWWIDKPSDHASHTLKHKYEYQKRMNGFVQNVLIS